MSTTSDAGNADFLWQNVVTAEAAIRDSLRAFRAAPSAERVRLVREALGKSGGERAAALRVIPYLSLSERQELFPELIRMTSWGHGMIQAARDAICSLPRDWVVARIESEVEPYLAASSEQHQFEEYRRFLELYEQLGDLDLLRHLAERAAQHADEDVREAAADALAGLR